MISHVLYSVVITRQSNPPISQFSSPCNEFKSGWSMFVYNPNIDLKLRNKLHGPMHCKIGVTFVLYSVVITRQSNPSISQFRSPCNEFTSFWSMFVYNNLSKVINIKIQIELEYVINCSIAITSTLLQVFRNL